MSAGHDRLHHGLDLDILDDDLDLELVGDVELVGLAAPLANPFGRLAVAAYVHDRESPVPGLLERRRDSLEPVGTEYCFHFLHRLPTSSRRLAADTVVMSVSDEPASTERKTGPWASKKSG